MSWILPPFPALVDDECPHGFVSADVERTCECEWPEELLTPEGLAYMDEARVLLERHYLGNFEDAA